MQRWVNKELKKLEESRIHTVDNKPACTNGQNCKFSILINEI